MADTVERSLKSILSQVDDRFEIVVVDDGSEDGSLKILDRIARDHSNVRIVHGNNNNLAEARNQSFEEANGEYILESMDADDRYDEGILDFIDLYHSIEDKRDDEFYLKGKSINIAPRSLLLKYPYRSLGYGEDRDLWRRLFSDGKIIWVDHEPFVEIMRESYGPIEELRNLFNIRVVDFRSGVSFRSYVRWCWDTGQSYEIVWRLIMGVLSYLVALKRGRYHLPENVRSMGDLNRYIERESRTVSELEEEYDINVNSDIL